MKQSFVKKLGDILFYNCVENSYFNDECDVDCLSPDLNAAYALINQEESLTPKDLEEVYNGYGDDEEPADYTGFDLLKLAVFGDFDEQYNSHSSELKNLKACLRLLKITKADRKIWESKRPTTPEGEQPFPKTETSYKQSICERNTLAEMVGTRAQSCALKYGPEGIKIAHEIGKKLRGYKGFENKSPNNITNLSSDDKDNPEGLKKLKHLASIIVNKKYDKIKDINDYSTKNALLRYIIYGESGDQRLDKIVDSTPAIKDKIGATNKTLAI